MMMNQRKRTSLPLLVLVLCLLGGLAPLVRVVSPRGLDETRNEDIQRIPTQKRPYDVASFFHSKGYLVWGHQIQDVSMQKTGKEHTLQWTLREESFHLVKGRADLDFEADFASFMEIQGISIPKGSEGFSWDHTFQIGEESFPVYRFHIDLQTPRTPLRSARSPRLAIVIDDWGYSSQAVNPLLEYPLALTVAILPHLPLSERVEQWAIAKGHEVIVHMPMEALNAALDPGPGAIFVSMDDEDIREAVLASLMHLPLAVGMNNHMGSRATADRRVMEVVLMELRERDLFFLDSYTTPSSVVQVMAEEVGLPFARNLFFLDNVNEEEHIKGQIRQALLTAKRRGSAIVIGHVRPETNKALWSMLPEILRSGVELVPISSLLRYP